MAHGKLGAGQNSCGSVWGLPRSPSVSDICAKDPPMSHAFLEYFIFHSVLMVSSFSIFHFFLVRKVHLYTIPITFHLSIKPFTGGSEDVVRPYMNSLKISHNFISHNLWENYILFLLCWWQQLQICWPCWMAHGNSSVQQTCFRQPPFLISLPCC